MVKSHCRPVLTSRLVAAGSIPRTTSGMLGRRACRAEYLNRVLEVR
jgi:acyl-CoA synthetase (AMP-forming)/AMP-acid ligase II